MVIRKRGKPTALESNSIERWIGGVDEKLNHNDMFHAELLKTTTAQHRELMKSISDLCGNMTHMGTSIASMSTQVITDTKRLDALEPRISGAERTISNIGGKLTAWAALVSGMISAIVLVGKSLLQHIISR